MKRIENILIAGFIGGFLHFYSVLFCFGRELKTFIRDWFKNRNIRQEQVTVKPAHVSVVALQQIAHDDSDTVYSDHREQSYESSVSCTESSSTTKKSSSIHVNDSLTITDISDQ